MAKKSMIQRELKREKLIRRYAAKRAALEEIRASYRPQGSITTAFGSLEKRVREYAGRILE